jgi:hypothetical protein
MPRQTAPQTIDQTREAAERGDPQAQFTLGRRYQNGWGVPKDCEQAAIWYRRAAEQGWADAQANLGVLYEEGRGIPRDDAQAVYWYGKAAEQGHSYAPSALGALIEQGRGIRLDRRGAADVLAILGLLGQAGSGSPSPTGETGA